MFIETVIMPDAALTQVTAERLSGQPWLFEGYRDSPLKRLCRPQCDAQSKSPPERSPAWGRFRVLTSHLDDGVLVPTLVMLGGRLRVPETEANDPFIIFVVPQGNQINEAWPVLQSVEHFIAHLPG
jgi:hypothetical protein